MHISPIFLMNNVENPRITEWTSTNVERSHRLPHVYTKMMYGKLGGYRLQEKYMIYLTPEPRLYFLFDQASSLQDSGLSEEVLLEEVLCKSLLPHCQHAQPACWPATSTQPLYCELSSSPGVQTRMLWRFPAPLQARTFARKNVRRMLVYLSISLSIYLSVCLSD